ncbi:MAG: DNA-directed RNA polymerase subunit alpha [Candidatus Lloydbacteria bacterium RIFCSPHIGHO2_01_FULL_49_22]|uniref:DNA-directed RNA polymerase subunit alpha n=1 Tax=Candidatus Lloydbacteria bacterium RIFCSPHIGHO2_01_FULL_49_22 TaxID=1798658 RepID=A0A1G2CUT7_9BACT|nr:MAG: DNA-directed RNA polymerase subunit alpha [Candidatus Lloydbacteria bacterium RIFCSPHIGHO2_01_FULL_49_22]OGZ10285.1 MAG: DNA-directed RNA polymerase subunit alpha [Candidatus Lloydbacteria bacterium RIFCSPHIGHO2_02_FULL_50_18]
MPDYNVALPSKPKPIREEGSMGVYEIEGLYPGYGHTLGNSLRRIILSSLPGAALTSLKIDGVLHEFSTIEGIKEDVITLILNLKKVRIKMLTDEPQTITLSLKGAKKVTAGDITINGQVEILNPEQYICEMTDKNAVVNAEMKVEKGLGYLAKESIQKEKVEIGTIALDAAFTPIRRVNYEVETMRVGDRTDYNRLKITIETDGTLTPRSAVENAIEIMIHQLKAIIGFKEEELIKEEVHEVTEESHESTEGEGGVDTEFLKTRIDSLDLSARTQNALTGANIRTVGGLVRKKEEDLMDLDGLGEKGVQEIKRALSNFGVTLKQ